MPDAIEPSEILTDRSGAIYEASELPKPWLRLLARYFDYVLFFFLIFWVRRWLGESFFPWRYEALIPIEYAAWMPIEALLLSTWGTTPGKWFLKIKIHYGRGKRVDFVGALRRSFHVWFRGLGMAIPFVNLLCLLVAYQKLMLFKKTSWDRDDHISVLHFPIPPWRWMVLGALTIAGLATYSSLR